MYQRRPFWAASLALLFASCGFIPQEVSWDDSRLIPLLKAIEAVDRSSLGFTPIDRSFKVRLESRPLERYDVMLHIDGKTSRTIAFRKTANGYKWIEEQECYTGPKSYTNVDGTFREKIFVTYGIESVSGAAPNQLHVDYWGEDPRLPAHQPLTLEQVAPIIAEWNHTK
jgi:hypothetical protein